MVLDFDKYAREANMQLDILAKHLGAQGDRAKAGRVLRAVLHTLREVLPVHESLHMLSQLPMFMKAVYVDAWDYEKPSNKIKTVDEFITFARFHDRAYFERDFSNDVVSYSVILVTLNFLKQYISEGEIEDIKVNMSPEVRALWDSEVTAI